MSRFLLALSLTFALGAAPLLTGCETETQREIESDGDVDVDTEIGLDDGVEAEAREGLLEAEEGLDEAGREIREAAGEAGNELDEAGREIREAAGDVHDAVDSNVDLGDNAENQ